MTSTIDNNQGFYLLLLLLSFISLVLFHKLLSVRASETEKSAGSKKDHTNNVVLTYMVSVFISMYFVVINCHIFVYFLLHVIRSMSDVFVHQHYIYIIESACSIICI